MAAGDRGQQIDPIGVLGGLRVRKTPESADSPRWTYPPLIVPLVILVAGTLLFRFTSADVAISRPFYSGTTHGWPLLGAQPWKAIYQLGIVPAWGLGIGGLVVAMLGFFWTRVRPWRRAGLFLALLLLLGPGLLVNALFKPHWMRPRPAQTAAFGGQEQFEPVWDMGQNIRSRSFPSGHASMGFYLMAPAFLVYKRRRRLALTWFGVGLIGGAVMGLTRIVQGGHFASDVFWSAGCVYLTGLLLYALLRLGRTQPATDATPADGSQVFDIDTPIERQQPAEEPDYRRAA